MCPGSVAPAHSVVIPGLLQNMRKALAGWTAAGVLGALGAWMGGLLQDLLPLIIIVYE